MIKITGNTLIDWGFTPGKWFGEAIEVANRMERNGESEAAIRTQLQLMQPPPYLPLQKGVSYAMHLDKNPDSPAEIANWHGVDRTMFEVMKTPTVRAGAAMPDACPAGSVGTIPVGGVIATENAIHPGMHSADICCSVAISVLGDVDPGEVLHRAEHVTHFGGGGRPKDRRLLVGADLMQAFHDNPFLNGLEDIASEHMGTQGDGNHFLFVGTLASTGDTCIVTHHGSRKPGAMLYKRGMRVAEKYRQELSPDTLKQNAWIPADTADGHAYWHALQLIREWTKRNHFVLHDRIYANPQECFWNEHNFVFQRDGLYYHGKGATPAWEGFASDSNGLTLIPLNMAEPVLITRGLDNHTALGFSPHGAGRNFSRNQHRKNLGTERNEAEQVALETAGIDARFYSGYPDVTELPSAYKNAASMRAQIEEYGLAEIVDEVKPYGCIMAGEWRKAFTQ